MTTTTTTRSAALMISDEIEKCVYMIARANHAGLKNEADLYKWKLDRARAELSKLLEQA